MKKSVSILTLLLLVATFSCKKSDDSGETNLPIDKTANLLGTGESANDILSNTTFDKLLVEIAYVEGFRPATSAMNSFEDFLRLHTFKEDIDVIYKELPPTGDTELELQEIADLETENRTAYNDGSTLAIYIFFSDAPSNEDDEDEGLFTLGAVFQNTSMVIYESTVRRLAGASSQITISDVELATMNHEFGHLFGLVDLGSVPVNAHEDPEALNHCNVEGCLMRAELQFQASSRNKSATSTSKNKLHSSCSLNGKTVLAMLQNKNAKGLVDIPPLNAECVLDLRANGGR